MLPEPFFDTQVAAMVCGYGDQAGYETLVRQIARAQVDKSSRFTDWSRRPLSAAQMAYALADVTHLRQIYEVLARRLDETGRGPWVEEELAVLTDPATYRADPEHAWTRIKTRSTAPRFLAALRELARFRETRRSGRNVPRNRILKDDALLELAANRPKSPRISASRGCSCARRAAARSPRASSPPSPPPRRCRAEVPQLPEAPARKPGRRGAGRPPARAPEGAGRRGGGGAAADRLERRPRRASPPRRRAGCRRCTAGGSRSSARTPCG